MDKLVIDGGVSLHGTVPISGAKNAALPILVATLLAPGEHVLHNVPELVDVSFMLSPWDASGAHRWWESAVGLIRSVWTRPGLPSEAPYDVVRKMRASVLVLGPLLARCGSAHVSLPGGCAIGVRPIDQHLKGLEALGCKFELEGGYVHGSVDQLVGADITLDVPTVTGTENIMMAAVLAEGVSVIRNAAAEPEIVDLARFLRSMGARIKGDGTDTIEIDGVPALRPARRPYRIMGDRIEAGTYLLAGAITGGDVTTTGTPVEAMGVVLDALKSTAAVSRLTETPFGFRARPRSLRSISPRSLTLGSPTDMQAQWVALMTRADGSATVEENIFENRFMHVAELSRMGANIHLNGNTATVEGGDDLTGATVMATDLRASASLVLAGLAARGMTEMLRLYHLDRGYERLVGKLEALGAQVKRVAEDTPIAVGLPAAAPAAG